MFDIGAAELLVLVIVAVLVIGPKEMPRAMRTAGRWIGQVRKVSAHFRTGIDAMVREAELEDMEKKWKAQNEEIMRKSAQKIEADTGEPVMTGPPPIADGGGTDPDGDDPVPDSTSAQASDGPSPRSNAPADTPEGATKPLAEKSATKAKG